MAGVGGGGVCQLFLRLLPALLQFSKTNRIQIVREHSLKPGGKKTYWEQEFPPRTKSLYPTVSPHSDPTASLPSLPLVT